MKENKLSKSINNVFKKTLDFCYENYEYRKSINEHAKSMHCATIFNGSKILSIGFNSNLRNKSFGMYNISEHAEACAIRNLFGKKTKHYLRIMSGKKYVSDNKKNDKNKLSMMVIRINKKGEIRNSKCCVMCVSQMKAFNIKIVYYTDDDGSIIREKVKYMTNNFISTGLTNITDNDYIHILIINKSNKKEEL